MNFKRYHVSKNLFDSDVLLEAVGWGKHDNIYSGYSSALHNQFNSFDKCIPVDAAVVNMNIMFKYENLNAPLFIVFWYTDGTKTQASKNGNPREWVYLSVKSDSNKTLKGIAFSYGINDVVKLKEIMVGSGSTPQPYEPYSSEVWHDIPYYVHNTSTDTITTLPVDIYADGNNATVGLKGNTVQSGTPTPDSPIMPQGTGERTGNLLNLSSYSGTSAGISDIVINGNSIAFNASSQFLAIVYEFNLGISDVYTLALGGESFHTRLEIRYTKDGVNVGSAIVIQPNRNATISGSEEYNGFRVYISNANNTGTCTASNIMLNTGSTLLPYENFGYKIPISSANATTPVYLGEVPTTRKIKKIVFDGTESWNEGTSNYYIFINISGKGDGIPNSAALSTHTESGVNVNNNGTALFFKKSVFVHSSLADFKSYLAQQYANGTPVTVWYVLSSATTGIVNEPIRKIGTYADEVSGVSIPVTAGANTLSVGTTLQPSEVSVNYKGWHPVADIHERDDGAWT